MFFLLAAVPAFAAPFKIDMKFDALELRNGQKLSAGSIKSYDHATGKVVIFANRAMSSVQLELLPEELGQKIISLVPAEAKAEAREEKAERKQQTQSTRTQAQVAAAAAQRAADNRAAASAAANAQMEERRRERQKQEDRDRGKSLALDKARQYFRYEYRPGSGSVLITGQGVRVDEPVEVVGWDRRYRMTGSVGLEFYDSRGRSFDRSTRNFEVTTGPNSDGVIVVLDFSLK